MARPFDLGGQQPYPPQYQHILQTLWEDSAVQKVRAVHSAQLSWSLIRQTAGHLKGQETRSPRQVRPPYHSTESVWPNIALAFHSTCPAWRSTRRFSPNDNYASFFNDLPRLFNPTYAPSTDVRSSLLRHNPPPVFRFPPHPVSAY